MKKILFSLVLLILAFVLVVDMVNLFCFNCNNPEKGIPTTDSMFLKTDELYAILVDSRDNIYVYGRDSLTRIHEDGTVTVHHLNSYYFSLPGIIEDELLLHKDGTFREDYRYAPDGSYLGMRTETHEGLGELHSPEETPHYGNIGYKGKQSLLFDSVVSYDMTTGKNEHTVLRAIRYKVFWNSQCVIIGVVSIWGLLNAYKRKNQKKRRNRKK